MKWIQKARRVPGSDDPARERNVNGAPAHDTSDSALIQRIARRERFALEQLYERYSAQVVGLALQVQPDRTRADEIALETFWYIWKHADRLHTGSVRVETWLPSLVAGIASAPLRTAVVLKLDAQAGELQTPGKG